MGNTERKPVDVLANLASMALAYGEKWEQIHDAVAELIEAAKRVEHSYQFEGPEPYDVFSKVDQDALQCLVAALARVSGGAK